MTEIRWECAKCGEQKCIPPAAVCGECMLVVNVRDLRQPPTPRPTAQSIVLDAAVKASQEK